MFSSNPNISIIGAGNLATHLSIALKEKGYSIRQVFSRTTDSAKTLADKLGADYTTVISEIRTDSDIYIFSLKDSALPEILSQIPPLKGLLLHTSGSIPIDIFDPYSTNYGVFYPLQTFSKTRNVDFSSIPICIEACGEKQQEQLFDLGKSISRKVLDVSSDQRKYLHLAAVFSCNFVNHLYGIASEILQQQHLPFDILLPLIDETAAKVHSLTPFEAQTGPAVRFDENIINKQLNLLNDENLKKIYELISKSIFNTYKQK